MQDTGILDLGLDPRYAQLTQAQIKSLTQTQATRRLPRFAGIGAMFAALVLALVATAMVQGTLPGLSLAFGGDAKPIRVSLEQQRELAAMTVEDKSQILAKGLDAQLRNAEIPLSAMPVEAVAALKFGMVDGSAQATALRCLTQAVYYEAAHEPLQGRRAVAQVVLNRVRHAAYHNSVCGVVY